MASKPAPKTMPTSYGSEAAKRAAKPAPASPEDDQPADAGADRYFWLPRDELVVRLQGGWNPQVWHGEGAGAAGDGWVDFEVNLATEGQEIDEAEAKAKMGGEGEFAAEDPATPAPTEQGAPPA